MAGYLAGPLPDGGGVHSLNMLGDALRDLLDPRLKGGVGRLGADAGPR